MQDSPVEFAKHVLARMNMPYPLGVLALGGEPCVVGSTEDSGPVVLTAPPYRSSEQILPGPGGSMALVADAEKPGELYAIMGCFLGYRFQTGAIYRIRQEGGAWVSSKIIDLPFAHRIDFVNRAGSRYLIAATLAADKKDPADWSRPGSLYACRVPRSSGERWEPVPVLEGIHRNHGLLVTRFMGNRSLLVSGAEGLFAADLDRRGSAWVFARIMRQEISEIAVCDVDGDGADELITIEPFHGNRLVVYRSGVNGWQKAWEDGLAFGHGLLAGKLAGRPAILVSNRGGARDLLLFQFPNGPAKPVRTVVDAGAGAANMLIVSYAGAERIFAANQPAGEIVMYSQAP